MDHVGGDLMLGPGIEKQRAGLVAGAQPEGGVEVCHEVSCSI